MNQQLEPGDTSETYLTNYLTNYNLIKYRERGQP